MSKDERCGNVYISTKFSEGLLEYNINIDHINKMGEWK